MFRNHSNGYLRLKHEVNYFFIIPIKFFSLIRICIINIDLILLFYILNFKFILINKNFLFYTCDNLEKFNIL